MTQIGSLGNEIEEIRIDENYQNATNSGEVDLVERYFAEREEDNRTNSNQSSISAADFLILLEEYEKIKRLHHSASVLQFWQEQKTIMPHIFDVACIFHSIPPTQATVERSFSALALIFTIRRTKLEPSLLANILTIKLNKEMVQQIFKEEIVDISRE